MGFVPPELPAARGCGPVKPRPVPPPAGYVVVRDGSRIVKYPRTPDLDYRPHACVVEVPATGNGRPMLLGVPTNEWLFGEPGPGLGAWIGRAIARVMARVPWALLGRLMPGAILFVLWVTR